jgi:hypothetical protein
MTEPILKSDKLTGHLAKLADLKSRAKQSNAEVQRLTKITHPQYLESTVRTVVNEKDDIHRANGVVLSTGDEKDAAARKAEELSRTLAGQPLADLTSVEDQLRAEHRQWSAIEEAIEFVHREIKSEKTALAVAYCKQRKPDHDRLMVKLCASLLETHKAFIEFYALKRHLVDNDVGLIGLCLTTPDFLDAPNNPYSDMADFFRAAKKEGFISKVPPELELPR